MHELFFFFFLQLCNNGHDFQNALLKLNWNNVSINIVSFVFLCLYCGSGMEEACLLHRAEVALFFSPVLRVSALSSLFPFPPRRRRSLTPPHHFSPTFALFGRETVTFFCPCCLIQESAETVFLPPWGTLRHPNRIGRARLSCSPFFQAKSSQPPGKACCSSQKW